MGLPIGIEAGPTATTPTTRTRSPASVDSVISSGEWDHVPRDGGDKFDPPRRSRVAPFHRHSTVRSPAMESCRTGRSPAHPCSRRQPMMVRCRHYGKRAVRFHRERPAGTDCIGGRLPGAPPGHLAVRGGGFESRRNSRHFRIFARFKHGSSGGGNAAAPQGSGIGPR
jgi:hypothetical protein